MAHIPGLRMTMGLWGQRTLTSPNPLALGAKEKAGREGGERKAKYLISHQGRGWGESRAQRSQERGAPPPPGSYLKLMLAQTSMSLSRKTLRSLDLISCPRSPYTVSVRVSHRSSCRWPEVNSWRRKGQRRSTPATQSRMPGGVEAGL